MIAWLDHTARAFVNNITYDYHSLLIVSMAGNHRCFENNLIDLNSKIDLYLVICSIPLLYCYLAIVIAEKVES